MNLEVWFGAPRLCSGAMPPARPLLHLPTPVAPGKLFAAPYWPSAAIGEDEHVLELVGAGPGAPPGPLRVLRCASCHGGRVSCPTPAPPDLSVPPVQRLSAKVLQSRRLWRTGPASYPLPFRGPRTPRGGWGVVCPPNPGQFEGVSCHQGPRAAPLESHHHYILSFPHRRGPRTLCPVSVRPLIRTQSLFLGCWAWGRSLVAVTPRRESHASGGASRARLFPARLRCPSGRFMKLQ